MDSREADIIQYLNQKKLKFRNKGFGYCVAAIKVTCDNPRLTKIEDIYGIISLQYNESEKCICNSIRYLLKSLGISNKEFILKAVHEIMSRKTEPDIASMLKINEMTAISTPQALQSVMRI